MTATPRFKLRLGAPHRVRNLAQGVSSAAAGATRTLRVPLPLVPRTASLLLHARATDSTGMVTPTVRALDDNGATLKTWTMPTEYAPDTVAWAPLHAYDLPRTTEALEVQLAGTTTAPAIVASQVTTDRRTDWVPELTQWADVTRDVISISSSRGGEGRGAWFEPEAGTLTITLKGDWSHLTGGTELEWTDAARGQLLFPPTTVADLSVETNARTGASTTTLYAHDDVETLSNTPRYGLIVPDRGQPDEVTERDGPWQSAEDQINQLLLSSPVPLVLEVHDPVGARLRSEQSEQNLAGHITMAATSTGASWCQRRDRRLIMRRVYDYFTTLNVVLADDEVATADPTRQNYCYTGLTLGSGTKDIVNTLTMDNFGGRVPDPDEPNGFKWVTVPHGPYTNEASVDQWGARADKLETCVHITSPSRPGDVARLVLETATPTPSPRAVTLNTAHGFPEHLDILDSIRVRHRRLTHDVYVTRIEHDLSDGLWNVTYHLAARQTAPQED